MSKTGSCLCGAVSYRIENVPSETGACHCSMCRKWSGGVYMAVSVTAQDAQIEGTENLTVFSSSEWGERGFCKTCGSSLFFRVTAPGPHFGSYHFGLGGIDDPSGLRMSDEIFIDEKPDAYAFAGDTKKMTGAEFFAIYAGDGASTK